VARRVLNRVFLCLARDTAWTMTQGDATVRGFTATGTSVGPPIRFPVYFRGMDPDVKVTTGVAHPGNDFLPNSMTYDPNVLGIAVVEDSLFATVRYRNWGMRIVHGDGLSLRRMAESSVEVINRRGVVVRAYDAPGMVEDIASDGEARVAIITRMRDNTRHLLVARVQP
jgi:hypothetical protein